VTRTHTVRAPVAAGLFYPSDPAELTATVDALLDDRNPAAVPQPVALVAPHAGYTYSGPVAASALALAAHARRVLLLGPSHFVPLAGLAVARADAWETPLGEVPVAPDLRELACSAGAVIDDVPHARDHALEVELPFLQRVCPDRLEILPVAVGRTAPGAVASFLAKLDALVVVSTDLSHYHPDTRAREIDRRTADAIVDRDTTAIADAAACGVFALRGLVEYARRRELRVEVMALRTSADTAGDRASVVGYGAFAFVAPKAARDASGSRSSASEHLPHP
jgi:AmmeMemoRadiSam system protein B